MRNRTRQHGFTLTEVMITVVIIGILAAIALPNYRRMIELGYLREAQDLLMTIYNGERAYSFANNSQYYDVIAEAPPSTEWRTIYMDNPNLGSIPVDFSVTAVGGASPTFTATAQRNPPAGSPCSASIDQNRALTVSASWAAGTC